MKNIKDEIGDGIHYDLRGVLIFNIWLRLPLDYDSRINVKKNITREIDAKFMNILNNFHQAKSRQEGRSTLIDLTD